jgi:hypothetical protein
MDEQTLKAQWWYLLFSVRRSVRYHNYRRKFFDALGLWTNFVTIIGGGGVIVSTTTDHSNPTVTLIIGALISLFAALNLVLGFSTRARDHFDLAKRFTKLEQDMTSIGNAPTEEQYREQSNTRLEIESDEPPINRVLDAWCHNELIRAAGSPDSERVTISRAQRFFRQFVSFGEHNLKKVGDHQ